MSVFDGWKNAADEFAAFVKENDGLPVKTSGDIEGYDEQRRWWIHQVTTNIPQKNASYLDSVVPNWNDVDTDVIADIRKGAPTNTRRSQQSKWDEKYDLLVKWVKDHDGSNPQRSDDPLENMLSVWRMNQRVAKPTTESAQKTQDERLAKLDANVPGWRGEKRREYRDWNTASSEFIQWVTDNGRLPSYPGKDADEMRYNFWMINMRNASRGGGTHTWKDSYGELLDEKTPGWRGGNRTNGPRGDWETNARELAAWINENGRFPRQSPKFPDERKKSIWLNNVRAASQGKAGKWNDDRQKLMDELIPGWQGKK
jgi:hypothetical protein